MIVLSLARAPLMKGAVKTWGTVSVVVCLGGCSPWGHWSGVQIFCTPSVLSHLGEVSPSPPDVPSPAAPWDCSQRLLWVWRVTVSAPAASSLNCSASLFCRNSVKLEGILHPAQLWRYWSASPRRSQSCSFWRDLIPGGSSQIGGATKNSCSDWDEGIGQWQKMTRIKTVSLTKWWFNKAKKM